MRVLAYSDSLEIGGAEVVLGYLLGALSEAVEPGLLVVEETVGEKIAAFRPGIPVGVVSRARGVFDAQALLAHGRAIRAFAPNILHVQHSWPWAGAHAEAAGLLIPRVRVLSVDQLPVRSALPRRQLLVRQQLARRRDAHIAVGEETARMIEDLVALESGSVISIPNGVPPAARDAVPVLPGPRTGPVIGATGRLTPQKGFDVLVRTLPSLPDAQLVLVGDGPERRALERLAAELDVARRLHITGWQQNARAFLPAFDIFALPSRWEGMPVAIVEAMHAGLPIVATDVGSVAELIGDGDSGFIVSPDDPIALRDRLAQLLADPALRARLGEAARSRASREFTASVMAQRYEAVYARLMAGSPHH